MPGEQGEDSDDDYLPRSAALRIVAEHASDLPEARRKALVNAIELAMSDFASSAVSGAMEDGPR